MDLYVSLPTGKNQSDFEGFEEFEGKKVHTHDYKDHRGYEGKKVVVVGIGNSGGDAAVELSRIADQVSLKHKLTRRSCTSYQGVPISLTCMCAFSEYI